MAVALCARGGDHVMCALRVLLGRAAHGGGDAPADEVRRNGRHAPVQQSLTLVHFQLNRLSLFVSEPAEVIPLHTSKMLKLSWC